MADRHASSEFGDGGVVVGQLLPQRQRLAVSASASDFLPVSSSRVPVRLTVSARLRLNSAVAPGAAANASRSARARR